MKAAIKLAIQAVTSIAAPVMWRLRRSPRLLVMMYHRVLPAGHPERATEQPGMLVSPETLELHIDILKRHTELMHLDDWITAHAQGKLLPRNCSVLTFDDGWLDNYRYAYPVLRRTRAPATIYLVSDLVGTSYAFWPNRLARLLSGALDEATVARFPAPLAERVRQCRAGVAGVLDSRAVDALMDFCKGVYTDAEMNTALDEVQRVDSVFAARDAGRDLMDWNEIREMGSDDLVRFGSHSRRHTRLLERLDPAVMADEVDGSLAAIEKELGKRPTTFCYPNGDHSARAVDAVRGRYLAAVTTRRGWNTPSTDRYLLNRVGVHDDVSSSRIAFLSRLAGVG